MDFHPNEYQLSLLTTLPMCVKAPAPAARADGFAAVNDLPDVTLSISYWDAGDGWDWHAEAASFDGVTVTRQSDPHTWELIRRGVERDREQLHERIVERIREVEGA